MKKTIVFCAAGTGGHLFPAQQLASELQEEYQIVFAGKNLSRNPYFDQTRFTFLEVNAATLSLAHPLRLLKAVGALVQGFCQSWQLLRRIKPSLMVGFGSFFSLPLLLAAKIKKVPIVLHEQNLLPGRVNRLFSTQALFLASTFPGTERYVKGRVKQVSFPRRFQEKVSKKEAAAYFNLKEGPLTLLVFGGSQGALFLNTFVQQLVSQLHGVDFQLLHFVGNQEERIAHHYKEQGITAVVKGFEPHMDRAYTLADIALCRAGAATINELLAFSLPAFLIPFPFATDDHQTKNAAFFCDVVQGGWYCSQKEVTVTNVVEIIRSYGREKLLAKKKGIQEYTSKEKVLSLSMLIKEIM